MSARASSPSSDSDLAKEDPRSPDSLDANVFIPQIVSKLCWLPSAEDGSEIRILDFGCGNGFNTKNILLPNVKRYISGLIHENFHIYAFDIVDESVQIAKVHNSHPRITYMTQSDLDTIPGNYFDKILSFRVLHYLKEPR
jgi:2-polyprenyl-3-methyl-5-hydroxy-6-metoxy-1,4-benzoquinol methylase